MFPAAVIFAVTAFLAEIILLPKTWGTAWRAGISLIVFAGVVFLDLALFAGSNVIAGAGLAGAMVWIAAPVLWPLLVAVGFGIRLGMEKIWRRKLRGGDGLAWGLCSAAAVVVMIGLLATRTQGREFREFVADDEPASVTDFHCWWQEAPGDFYFVVSLRLKPEDFQGTRRCQR